MPIVYTQRLSMLPSSQYKSVMGAKLETQMAFNENVKLLFNIEFPNFTLG